MKCPSCQRRLKFEAVTCLCGWRASSVPRAPKAPEPQEPPMTEAEIRARRAELSGQIQSWVKKFRSKDTISRFDLWAKTLTQATVDILVRQAAGDPSDCLMRLQRACVIDEKFRLIPLEKREALREVRQQERLAAEREFQSRISGTESHA